jgi:hypothetical protein
MHVTTSAKRNQEWGTIYSSNWNGTYYRQSLTMVNRDTKGYVDFERIAGIEGVAMANQVINSDQVMLGEPKQLRSLITYDNGMNQHTLATFIH